MCNGDQSLSLLGAESFNLTRVMSASSIPNPYPEMRSQVVDFLILVLGGLSIPGSCEERLRVLQGVGED